MTEIWGHRGAYSDAPENTLAAFETAAALGADGVELDVQLTRDGELVVIHDETVDRTGNGSGLVGDFTLAAIKKLNFNKRGITPPAFMEIPTLAEVLELLKPTGMKINIELKTGVVFYKGIEEKALELIKAYDILDRVIWSSFNHYSVLRVKTLEPSAKTALLCGGGLLVTGEQCEKTGACALHPGVRQLKFPGLVEDCHRRGVKVHVWTVNRPEDLRLAQSLGVDAVITNSIGAARQILQAR